MDKDDLLKMSTDELIEILNNTGPFPELLEALKAKGLSGSIMAVSDDEESEQARGYIEYHSKLPKTYPHIPEEDIDKAKKNLLDKKTSLEDKKIALVTLGHVGRIDAYKVLEKYEKNPDEKLKIWINMALQESQAFLASDLQGEPGVRVGRVSKVGRNDPCPCGSGKKFKKCCWGKEL